MSDQEIQSCERELRQLKPAAPPQEFVARLVAEWPAATKASRPRSTAPNCVLSRIGWWQMVLSRWFFPATALLVLGVFAWRSVSPDESAIPSPREQAAIPSPREQAPALSADEVSIDQTLVSSFDAIARLPGGEPVRFRCRTWMDDVVLRDSARGVEIRQKKPRMEVIPVRFETY